MPGSSSDTYVSPALSAASTGSTIVPISESSAVLVSRLMLTVPRGLENSRRGLLFRAGPGDEAPGALRLGHERYRVEPCVIHLRIAGCVEEDRRRIADRLPRRV